MSISVNAKNIFVMVFLENYVVMHIIQKPSWQAHQIK